MRTPLTIARHGARAWSTFLAWSLVGALAALGIAALLTVGIVFLLASLALGGFLMWRRATGDRAPWGLGLGVALVVGYLGWLNRGGPGTVCQATGQQGISCSDEWSPWPFFAVAALLGLGVISAFLIVPKRSRAGRDQWTSRA